eukprot:3569210-Prymnesium_polylepis.1
MAGTRDSRSRGSVGCDRSRKNSFCTPRQCVPCLCTIQFAPRWPEQTLELYLPFQRQSGRHGDVAAATSSSSARGSADEEVRCLGPPPAVHS